MRILSWILHALRPLTVSELQCALAIEPRISALDEDALPDDTLCETVCAGFVTMDQESSIIRLVHYTAEEFLLGVRKDLFPTATRGIVACCISWLLYDDHATEVSRPDEDRFWPFCSCNGCERHGRFAYGGQSWLDHVRGNLEEDLTLQSLLLALFSDTVVMNNLIHVVSSRQYPSYGWTWMLSSCGALGLHSLRVSAWLPL